MDDKRRMAKESTGRRKRRRRAVRHSVSNKASNLTAGGGEAPSSTGSVHGTRGRTDRFDVSKY